MAKRKRPATGGYWPAQTTRRATVTSEFIDGWGDLFPTVRAIAPGEGAEPFWAEIRDDLTFEETGRIPAPNGARFADLWAAIAPSVVAWNATAVDQATNERVAVPPPAECGVDAFRTQLPGITLFLVAALKYHADLNLPKRQGRTDDTPAG